MSVHEPPKLHALMDQLEEASLNARIEAIERLRYRIKASDDKDPDVLTGLIDALVGILV